MYRSARTLTHKCLAGSVVAALALTAGVASGSPQDKGNRSTATDAQPDCAGDTAESHRGIRSLSAGGCRPNIVTRVPPGFDQTRLKILNAANKLIEDVKQAVTVMPLSDRPYLAQGRTELMFWQQPDEANRFTKHFVTFESLTVELPISAKGTPAYSEVMSKLNAFAEIVADLRGSSSVEVLATVTSRRHVKVVRDSTTFNSSKGNPIAIHRSTEIFEIPGIERITVKAPRTSFSD